MIAQSQELNAFTLPRIAQLTQRTNQFNLRTQRYSEEQVLKLTQQEGYICKAYSLKDKFGDLGIVSAVLLKPDSTFLFIDTWIMSCRVFGRGLEYLVWEELKKLAVEKRKILRAEYIPTPKNKPVATLLPDLGFELMEGYWLLDPKKGKEFPHFIYLENKKP